MKILFNQNLMYNTQRALSSSTINKVRNDNTSNAEETISKPTGISVASYGNLSFGAKPDNNILIRMSDKFLCAYSRKPMISPYEIKTIYAKLAKKPNTISAVNCLQMYEDYMHDVETTVFNVFKDYPNKGKKTFQDILQENYQDSLEDLKQKELNILNGKNDLIDSLPDGIKKHLTDIRNDAAEKINDGTFKRKALLSQIKDIKTGGENSEILNEIFKHWYTMPRSYMDYSAFVVKYAAYPHDAIAQRLLSTAVATIEHIKPAAKGGQDNLGNYLLVSKLFNNDKDTLSLEEYIELNPELDIKHNLQRYIDDAVNEIKSGKSVLSCKNWYPKSIAQTIAEETNGKFIPNVEEFSIDKSNKLTSSAKGANRNRSHKR